MACSSVNKIKIFPAWSSSSASLTWYREKDIHGNCNDHSYTLSCWHGKYLPSRLSHANIWVTEWEVIPSAADYLPWVRCLRIKLSHSMLDPGDEASAEFPQLALVASGVVQQRSRPKRTSRKPLLCVAELCESRGSKKGALYTKVVASITWRGRSNTQPSLSPHPFSITIPGKNTNNQVV